MKVEKIRIQNFRAFKDETVDLSDYTCLVGCNGAGKSTILGALNVFFRNTSSSATNVMRLSEEDFHHRNTDDPVVISVTLKDLSDEAITSLSSYVRFDRLTVVSRAEWDSSSRSAEVKQYGSRRVMPAFAPFFKAIDDGAKATEQRTLYDGLRKQFGDLPACTSATACRDALQAYENNNPDLCEDLESESQFYGFTKGVNLLRPHIQWVYVPAVKDASSEQDESSRSALGQLLERTIRTRVNFKDSIDKIRADIEKSYRELLDAQQGVLSELGDSMQARLREWATPTAALALNWHFDPNKSFNVNEPSARATIGDDTFVGEIARLGHGMQRSFLLALLQELALTDAKGSPTLLLGIEEPELYQHPPQAQHLASVLEELTQQDDQNCQVIVCTHSPYFVPMRGVENVRLVRKQDEGAKATVTSTDFRKLAARIGAALGEDNEQSPSNVMATMEQIMSPSQKELYFSHFALLIEGVEEISFIGTHLQLRKRWNDFRKSGCHFVITGSKTNMSRPLAIALELGIRHLAIFDGDNNCKAQERANHEKNNLCILRMCGLNDPVAFPARTFWGDSVVQWRDQLSVDVIEDFGKDRWLEAREEAKKRNKFVSRLSDRNKVLISATLELLAEQGVYSNTLDKLCDHLLTRAAVVPRKDKPVPTAET